MRCHAARTSGSSSTSRIVCSRPPISFTALSSTPIYARRVPRFAVPAIMYRGCRLLRFKLGVQREIVFLALFLRQFPSGWIPRSSTCLSLRFRSSRRQSKDARFRERRPAKSRLFDLCCRSELAYCFLRILIRVHEVRHGVGNRALGGRRLNITESQRRKETVGFDRGLLVCV